MTPAETTQLRGLFGSLQWPLVPIYYAPHGRIWHLDDQCYQLYRSQVIELIACDNYASLNDIHDISHRILTQDLDAFIGNGISDEDPEIVAETSAILDEEARLRAAGSLSSAGV